jgi:Glycosyl-transferase for dystroglycan
MNTPSHSALSLTRKAFILVSLIIVIRTLSFFTALDDDLPLRGHDDTVQPPSLGGHPEMNTFQRNTIGAPECAPMKAKDVSYTLVIQMSMDRLWMMQYHCKRWGYGSPVSVAVLTNQSTFQTMEALVELGCDQNALTVQTIPITEELVSSYPVNQLRQMAMSGVRTSHVLSVDIDFWVSVDLYHVLNQSSVRETLAMDKKRALVVPAFQLQYWYCGKSTCPPPRRPRLPKTREQIISAMRSQKVLPFDFHNHSSRGHGSTLYDKWIEQEPGSLVDIPCIQSNWYEPYVALRYCRDMPPFQTSFSGYGKNMIAWTMQLRRDGYMFSQLGGAFLVHFPHPLSASRKKWKLRPRHKAGISEMATRANTMRGRNDAKFAAFKKWMESNIDDIARVPMCESNADDDSRLWIERTD